MTARTPRELSEGYCRAFNARDLAGIVALYDDEALLVEDRPSTIRSYV